MTQSVTLAGIGSTKDIVFIQNIGSPDIKDARYNLAKTSMHRQHAYQEDEYGKVHRVCGQESDCEANELGTPPLDAPKGKMSVQKVRGHESNTVSCGIAEFGGEPRQIHASENHRVSEPSIGDTDDEEPRELAHVQRFAFTQYCPPSGNQPNFASSGSSLERFGGTKRQ